VQTLVTGISGYVGAAVAPRLRAGGHSVRGFTRQASRVRVETDELVEGDALSGAGLDRALAGVEVAYYLIHSMEGPAGRTEFAENELRAAANFAEAAVRAGVPRTVYLGGLVPSDGAISRHLASRLAVEEMLLAAAPDSIALRASIVVGSRSRSFRFLVRLI
jgi:nucleoside-diphosphate-sugar epimerase